jgi:DNA-binding NtrC family response regulator/tetratricopeptide (TPR) repeat protein
MGVYELLVPSVRDFIGRAVGRSQVYGTVRPFSSALAEVFSQYPTTLNYERYSSERLSSDLVGLTASLAQGRNIVFVIEDVHLADHSIIRFLEQMCCRAAEVNIKLLLTARTQSRENQWLDVLRRVLGTEIREIILEPLTTHESQTLLKLIGAGREQQDVLAMSSGNPFFIEQYVKNGTAQTPAGIQSVLISTLSDIPDSELKLAQALSVLNAPVDIVVLSAICADTASKIRDPLQSLRMRGLLEGPDYGVVMRPAAKPLLLRSMTHRRRVSLYRRTFEILRENEHSPGELATYAFRAELAHEAGELYRQAAADAMAKKNYSQAACYYKSAQSCVSRGGAALRPNEREMLAACYHKMGKVAESRRLYQELIASAEIQKDPELLSLAQVRLAATLHKTEPEARVSLHRQAIEALPIGSLELPKRYSQLCCTLIKLGDIPSAEEALQKAEELMPVNDTHFLAAKGSLLINAMQFKAAAKYLQSRRSDTAAINNLGFCFEQLGKLRKAQALFKAVCQRGAATGYVPAEMMGLSNLGSIRTKLGDLYGARNLHADALARFELLRKREQSFDPNSFMTIYADVTTHHMHTANFKEATDYLRRLRPAPGLLFALDRIFCELVKCEFYQRLGQRKKAAAILAKLAPRSLLSNSFLQIQKTLIEVRINRDASEKTITALQQALASAQKIETLYLQCEVLNELARVSIEMNDNNGAAHYAKRALGLSRRNGYRLLGARALLLAGMCAESQAQKQRYLYGSFQDASEMGLRELIAESAFQIGMFQLSLKNFVTAQEYLMRSISVVEDIAEGVPDRFRATYLALGPHRKALQALKICNPEVQKLLSVKSSTPDFGSEKRYFAGLYQLTASANAGESAEAVVNSIANSLEATLSRAALVTLKHGDGYIDKAVRVKSQDAFLHRAHEFIGKTKDRIYLGANTSAPHKPVAWIPLKSAVFEGGIYVVCGPQERSFTEKEIEFLTVAGTIGSFALNSLEARRDDAIRSNISESHNIIGASKAIEEVHSHIEAAAGNAATVLIEGESGTGKELVAKAIHAAGARSKEPFVAVDCGALPESLIEAELFGARKGSYTGAVADRPGLFEAAHRGTLFLDEISNTTPGLQAKLLRVIQEREVRRIGETKGRPVDVRLIAATNQDLKILTEDGRFRTDLLYRLKVLHIRVPPLRNRRDDIPMLVQAFLQKLNTANQTKKYFSTQAMDQLSAHDYPGNVRELQNTIERAFFSAKGTAIVDIPLPAKTPSLLGTEDVVSWFKDLSEGRKDFWSAVHNKYKRRDISREKVVALVDFGLRSTQGNYKALASTFHLKQREYRRFMDFLRRNDCLLDFRPYRKSAADREN